MANSSSALAEPFRAVWASSASPDFVVDPQQLVEFGAGQRIVTERERIWNDQELVVSDPPKRLDQSVTSWESVHGCYNRKNNICLEHSQVTQEMVGEIERISKKLNAWADSKGKDTLNTESFLLLLKNKACDRGAGARSSTFAGPQDMVVMVADARFRPKVQYFAACHLESAEASERACRFAVPDVPFHVRLCVTHPRMDRFTRLWKGLHILTTQALALELTRVAPARSWGLHVLQWQEVDGAENLLVLKVVEVSEEFSPPDRTAVKLPWQGVLAELHQANPFSEGRSAPTQSRGGEDLRNDGSDGSHSDDYEGVIAEDPEVGDLSDFAQGVVAASSPAATRVAETEQQGDAEKELTLEDAVEILDQSGGGKDLPAHSRQPPTVEDFVAASTVHPNGNVTCALPPFSSMARVGRLTHWPSAAPFEKQSTGMKCEIHTRCSAARMRKKREPRAHVALALQRATTATGPRRQHTGGIADGPPRHYR